MLIHVLCIVVVGVDVDIWCCLSGPMRRGASRYIVPGPDSYVAARG